MPLGKLGAFGKTNALEVGQNLMKDYNQGLVAAENIRKDNLRTELAIREERRATAKAARDQADYDKKKELLDFDEVGRRSGMPTEVVDMYKQEYKMRGLINDKGMIQRSDLGDNFGDVSKSLTGRGDRILDAMINQQTKIINDADAELAKGVKPERKAELEIAKRNAVKRKGDLYRQKPAIEAEMAKELAKQEVQDSDPKRKAEIEHLQSQTRKENALARKYDRDLGEDEKKVKMTPANAKQIGEAAYNDMLATLDLSPSEMDMYKKNMVAFSSDKPEQFAVLNATIAKAKRIFLEGRGHLSPEEAVIEAKQEVADDRKREEYNVRFGSNAYPSESAQAVAGSQKSEFSAMDTPKEKFELTKNKLTISGPYKYKDKQGKEHWSKDKTSIYFKTPDGFTDKDAEELAIEIDKARSRGVSFNTITDRLRKIGFELVFK